MERPRVGVVLLNWNGGEFTRPCIESLLGGEVAPWRILVFDNGSTDGSDDEIERVFPNVELVRSPENKGFAGGNNEGARVLLEQGADLIWILNNDTVVDRDCLKVLAEAYLEDTEVGALTGKILFEKPNDRIWYGGGGWRPGRFLTVHRGAGEKDEGQYDRTEDVGFVSGCSMLIPRRPIEEIGLFDERYFIYCEDAEWCLRAGRHGLRLRYVPAARLWHKVSATMRKNTVTESGGATSPMSYYLNHRNRLFYMRRYAKRPFQLFTSVSYQLFRAAYLAVALVLVRRWDKLRSLLRGVRDGMLTPQ